MLIAFGTGKNVRSAYSGALSAVVGQAKLRCPWMGFSCKRSEERMLVQYVPQITSQSCGMFSRQANAYPPTKKNNSVHDLCLLHHSCVTTTRIEGDAFWWFMSSEIEQISPQSPEADSQTHAGADSCSVQGEGVTRGLQERVLVHPNNLRLRISSLHPTANSQRISPPSHRNALSFVRATPQPLAHSNVPCSF